MSNDLRIQNCIVVGSNRLCVMTPVQFGCFFDLSQLEYLGILCRVEKTVTVQGQQRG